MAALDGFPDQPAALIGDRVDLVDHAGMTRQLSWAVRPVLW